LNYPDQPRPCPKIFYEQTGLNALMSTLIPI